MTANNHKSFLDNFAKFLIFLSFFIFVIGFSYDSFSKKSNEKYKTKNEVVDDGSSISITTTNENPTNPIDDSNGDISNTSGNNDYVDNTPVNNENNNSSNVPENNNSSNVPKNNNNKQNNSSIDNKNNNAVSNDLANINNQLRNEIENEFNVTVKYGSETNGYSVSGIFTTPITSEAVINSSLIHLKNTLGLYPKGMFKEISDGGIPLTIYLINNYEEENITGVTDSSYSYANISIAVIYPFEESFYHESYHYIERFMFKNGASFENWNSLNPPGFNYGTISNDLSYSNTFSESAPFVNNYAQTDDKEDRASTFEYMMASSKASCLNNGQTVWRKAMFMSRTMDAVLNSVSPNAVEYWERYLY